VLHVHQLSSITEDLKKRRLRTRMSHESFQYQHPSRLRTDSFSLKPKWENKCYVSCTGCFHQGCQSVKLPQPDCSSRFQFHTQGRWPTWAVDGDSSATGHSVVSQVWSFLHAESSVASLASYFNPYIKSGYFMEPGKYGKVCLFVTSIGRIWKATSWRIKQLKK